MTGYEHDNEVEYDLAPPAPTYASVQMSSHNNKSLFNPASDSLAPAHPPPPPSFAVPTDYAVPKQKGFKSNSWFSTVSLQSSNKAVRRVASAPNAKLLNMTRQQSPTEQQSQSTVQLNNNVSNSDLSTTPTVQRLRLCRRTYSSSSIKVKKVEVGPSSFAKVRMLGKGDVGKVYMVRQKESDKLYAMKGTHYLIEPSLFSPTPAWH